MSVTTSVYGLAQKHFANGDINWTSDTVKVSLHTSSYSPAQDTDEFYSNLTNELAASGNYSTGGSSLAGKAVSYTASGNIEVIDANDLTFSALTPSAAFRYAVVYKSTGVSGTSPLICWVDFGADQNPAGSDFTLTWAATGVLKMVAT